jgi:hypothetical protein
MNAGEDFLDLVRREEEKAAPLTGVFGMSRHGSYVGRRFLDFDRIDFRTGESRWVNIFVPGTESGLKPLKPDEQPYGWDGKINDYSAEIAVWWAFEITTELEAREFMAAHRPLVHFEYVRDFRTHSLDVKYNGTKWIVV